jgi:signal transduction histidine kinase
VGGESRQDEMGDLIKVFNRMTNEVVISREDLKRRVEEATRDREKALQRLALEQRLSATGRLATGVAHEINNPLGGMINAARTLAGEKGLSARATEYVGLIEDGLKRIATIVERLRSFIRPHGEVARVDLVRTWRGAVSFAHHRIEKEGIALVEDCPVEAGAVAADGDAGELQQVFLNLALNALDAMGDSARKELKVSVRRTDAWAIVEVADTGVGMDAQQLANAFDLFYSTKESGTGLGLAIAHRIVTDHGGEIEIESVVGSGTTVRVKLPSPGVEA